MITNFKIFENNSKYKIGDVIEILDKPDKIISKIMSIRYADDVPIYWVREFGGTMYDSFEVGDDDVIRKLEDHEIAAIKYNL